jgi:hypothetical protein
MALLAHDEVPRVLRGEGGAARDGALDILFERGRRLRLLHRHGSGHRVSPRHGPPSLVLRAAAYVCSLFGLFHFTHATINVASPFPPRVICQTKLQIHS